MKQTAFITGSSRGIGRAIARRFAQSGYTIILHGLHDSPELQATHKELKKIGAESYISFFDVSDRTAVIKSCKSLLKKTGTVDILVNNAGIIRDTMFLKMSDTDWDSVIKTNLYGPFYVTQQFLPKMKKKGFGRIINMSSIAARGAFGKANYAAAKAGVIAMTKSLALEVAMDNITVNAVCPGYINTDMSATIPAKYRKQFLSQIALGRIGSPEEVANIVAFLASRESSYITGTVIDVNGGWI